MYVVSESDARDFEFQVDGVVYSVPRRESLPIPKFRELRKRISEAENQEEEAIDAILDLFEEYAPGAVAKLNFAQAVELITAYTSGEELGESSPSSD